MGTDTGPSSSAGLCMTWCGGFDEALLAVSKSLWMTISSVYEALIILKWPFYISALIDVGRNGVG